MLDNETRLKLQTDLYISATPLSIIESELIKVEQSIERKWAILDRRGMPGEHSANGAVT